MSSVPRTTGGPGSVGPEDPAPPSGGPPAGPGAAPPPPAGADGVESSWLTDPLGTLFAPLLGGGNRPPTTPPEGQGVLDVAESLFRQVGEWAGLRPRTAPAPTTTPTPPAAPTTTPTPPAAPATATPITLGLPAVAKQVDLARRPMDELAQYCPRNNEAKQAVFRRLFEADDGLDKAKQTLTSAQKTLEHAQARNAQNPGAPTNLAPLQNAVTRAESAVVAAEAKVASAETNLRAHLKQQSPGRFAEIDALDLSARVTKQTTYIVDVGGQKVSLIDNVKSYATTRNSGLQVNGRSEPVGPIIDASRLGASTKTILKATSSHEGNFASVNGYDRMGVSFGMIQFAGGAPGSMLCRLIERFKKSDPTGFASALGQFGIDVTGKPPQLTCKDNEGNVLKKDAAAQFIGSDPRLCAALSASGNVPAMKIAQIELSAELLTGQRRHKAPRSDLTAGDILTSEYGNALLYDRSVNLGPGGTTKAFDAVVNKYLEAHPGADMASDPARAEIEAAFIKWAEQAAPGRYPSISASTSHEAGSFVQ